MFSGVDNIDFESNVSTEKLKCEIAKPMCQHCLCNNKQSTIAARM